MFNRNPTLADYPYTSWCEKQWEAIGTSIDWSTCSLATFLFEEGNRLAVVDNPCACDVIVQEVCVAALGNSWYIFGLAVTLRARVYPGCRSHRHKGGNCEEFHRCELRLFLVQIGFCFFKWCWIPSCPRVLTAFLYSNLSRPPFLKIGPLKICS